MSIDIRFDWALIAGDGPAIEPLKKPCHDCAVVTGFYGEYADGLAKEPADVQNRVMDTWFCHNACNRGCAGIREFIKST